MNFKQRLVFSFFMSSALGLMISFFISVSTVGFSSHLISTWMKRFAEGFCIAFPSAFLVSAIAHKITSYILAKFQNQTPLKKKIIFTIVMSMMMNFIISGVTMSIENKIDSNFIPIFIKAYFEGILVSIPLVFLISPIALKIAKKF